MRFLANENTYVREDVPLSGEVGIVELAHAQICQSARERR